MLFGKVGLSHGSSFAFEISVLPFFEPIGDERALSSWITFVVRVESGGVVSEHCFCLNLSVSFI